MSETMEHYYDDVWKMQEQRIPLFNMSLLQNAWETDTHKHYGSPNSTAKERNGYLNIYSLKVKS